MADHPQPPPPPADGIIPPSLQPQILALKSLCQLLNDFQFEYVVETERIRRRGLQHQQFTAATKTVNNNNNNNDSTVMNNSNNQKKPAPLPTPAAPDDSTSPPSVPLPTSQPPQSRLAPPPPPPPPQWQHPVPPPPPPYPVQVLGFPLQPVTTGVALNNGAAAWAPQNSKAAARTDSTETENASSAAAAAAITGKFELNWEEQMLQLEAFKKKFGHVNVSLVSKKDKSYLPLYRWTLFQKRQWTKFLKGEPCSPMIQLHMDRLIRVGLGTRQGPTAFPRASPSPTPATSSSWDMHFLELVKFKIEHGHTDLSVHIHKDTHLSLARWVSQQRQAYLNLQQKKKTGELQYKAKGVMKEDQVEKLRSIGFRFNPLQLSFAERMEQIKMYKARFGNTKVPVAYSEHNNLGFFVDRIRKKFRNGKMNPDQIAQLQAIDFDFSIRRRGPLLKDKQVEESNSNDDDKEEETIK